MKVSQNLQKYPKFKSGSACAYPKRKNCNYDDECSRCEFMKYNNSKTIFDSTRWECTFKKEDGKKIN